MATKKKVTKKKVAKKKVTSKVTPTLVELVANLEPAVLDLADRLAAIDAKPVGVVTDQQKNLWVSTLTKHDAPFWIINKCLHRMANGAEKYGTYTRNGDKRNLNIEIEKELLDAINYLIMEYEGDTVNGILNELIDLTVRIRELR